MRRRESRQLYFAFADSPQGSKEELHRDASRYKSHLLQIAKTRKTKDSNTKEGPERGLMDSIASPENLAAALLQVARNKGAPGPDGVTIEQALKASPRLLNRLRSDLLSGRYQPGEVRRVEIPKPGGGSRDLGIPNVVDRWVQQATLQILAPLYEPNFHTSSHGFRPDRGAETAIAEAKGHLTGGCSWVVSIDLSKFFDRVNHQRLLARLAQSIPDKNVLRLIHQMLKAKVVMPDGIRVNSDEGTPQGGPLSPLLSNVVLDELDWELQRRKLRFVRYADDFNVYVSSERAGKRVMVALSNFIEKRLRLKVNVDKSEVAPPQQVHLLGFSLKKNDEGKIEVHLSKRTLKRMRIRIRELTPRNWGNSLVECFRKANEYLKGWSGYFKLCTKECERKLLNFDAHVRRRIRVIVIKQKKKSRFLCRHLVERGVKLKTAAKTAFGNHGPWKKSNLPGLTLAYGNAWFAKRLTSLWKEWLRLNPPCMVPTQQTLEF